MLRAAKVGWAPCAGYGLQELRVLGGLGDSLKRRAWTAGVLEVGVGITLWLPSSF